MNSVLELLKERFGLHEIVQQPIKNKYDEVIGFHTVIKNHSSPASAGGTSEKKDTSLRIALSEAIERSFFNLIFKSDTRNSFYLDVFPTTCGFAAGFEREPTKFRAICEGLERWIWSKWIDDFFLIPDDNSIKDLTPLSEHLASQFTETLWFRREFQLNDPRLPQNKLQIGIFVGLTEQGAFAGSRVTTLKDQLWEHAIVEAYRNLQNSLFFRDTESHVNRNNMVEVRANYFSKHRFEAIKQIRKSYRVDWPTPELLLLKEHPTEIGNVYLFRCLFKDFIGWHLGPEDRFVY